VKIVEIRDRNEVSLLNENGMEPAVVKNTKWGVLNWIEKNT
jgi:hypothetical protein